jgi:hypothetical protein
VADPSHPVLRLQRVAGNRAVTGLLACAVRGKPVLQRTIEPEDVAVEMPGKVMRVTGDFVSGPVRVRAGDEVTVVAWSNASSTVQVRHGAGPVFDIPKRVLEPKRTPVAGVAPYGAGVREQVRSVERGQAAITAEQTRPGGPRPGEIPRLERLQQTREETLNRRLIQAMMYNRFDGAIAHWTAFYNTRAGYTGARALDPNLVKSMLFQESQLGTAGRHLEDPPTHPVKTRFNLGQVIDSSALALLGIMAEMAPGLITRFRLGSLRTDLAAAQRELADLRRLRTPTAEQARRIAELTPLSAQSWETYIWAYPGYSAATAEFFRTGGGTAPLAVPLNLDYDFWIRAMVSWLFEKRRAVSNWAEAIEAYNGSGAQARHYRDAVTARGAAAAGAERSGTEYIPGR